MANYEADDPFDWHKSAMEEFLSSYPPEKIADDAGEFLQRQKPPEKFEPKKAHTDVEEILHRDTFMAKFYEEYDALAETLSPARLPERVSNFLNFFHAWHENTVQSFMNEDTQASQTAAKLVKDISLRDLHIYARRRHILFKTKSLSNGYSTDERLQYEKQALFWEKNITLTHWAEVKDKKFGRLRR